MLRRALAAACAIQIVRVWRHEGGRWVLHNLVGHPLLVLLPRLGELIHYETIPEDEAEQEIRSLDTAAAGGHDGALPGLQEDNDR